MKFSSEDLNSSPCPSYPTNTYTCEVTIAPKMYSNQAIIHYNYVNMNYLNDEERLIKTLILIEDEKIERKLKSKYYQHEAST